MENFIIDALEHEAITFNGHLFRRQATTYIDAQGHRRVQPASVDGTNDVEESKRARAAAMRNRGRGKSKHYEVEIHLTSGEMSMRLERATAEGHDLTVPSTAHVDIYRDIFVANDSKYFPTCGSPKYATHQTAPSHVPWSMALDGLRSKAISMIIIDGYLVWVGASMGGSQVTIVDEHYEGADVWSFAYRPYNHPDGSADFVNPTWDGMIYQLSPTIFATSHADAMKLCDLIHRSKVTIGDWGSYKKQAAARTTVEEEFAFARRILNEWCEVRPELVDLPLDKKAELLLRMMNQYPHRSENSLAPRMRDEMIREWIESRS